MTNDDTLNISIDTKSNAATNGSKSTMEQLIDANHEIEGLKIQLAWFERSCDDL